MARCHLPAREPTTSATTATPSTPFGGRCAARIRQKGTTSPSATSLDPTADWDDPAVERRSPHSLPHGRGVVLQDDRGPHHRPGRPCHITPPSALSSRNTTCTVSVSSPIATPSNWAISRSSGPTQLRHRSLHTSPRARRPLIPFGGGIDSIVTVAALREGGADAALCIVHPPDDRFAAIEDAAAVTGLPIVRIAREIDPLVRRSDELRLPQWPRAHHRGDHRGRVSSLPSSIERDAVVLSNEWSASVPTLVHEGRPGEPPVVQGH